MAKVGSLGPVVFEVGPDLVRTFQSLEESGSARIHEHEPALSAPVAEFMGSGSRKISLDVRLNASLGAKPKDTIPVLEEARDSGRLLPLTIGGQLRGGPGAEWLIESMTSTEQAWGPGGEATIVDVSLALVRARTSLTPAPLGSTVSKSGVSRER